MDTERVSMSVGPDTTRRHETTGPWGPERRGDGTSRRTITAIGLVAVGFAVVMIVVGWRAYHQPPWTFAVAELGEGSISPVGWHPSSLSRWADLLSLNALVYGTLFWLAIVWRWYRADRATRRRHARVWIGILVVNATLDAGAMASLFHRGDIGQAMLLAYGVGLVALPFVFLSGVLYGQFVRGRVADLVIALEQPVDAPTLRRLLAQAVGDPTLEVLFRSENGHYADIDGRPASLPDLARTDRVITYVGDLAALVHAPAIADRPALVRAVVAAARLALSNARLQALQRRQIEELQSSRRRIALAALGERRRIERDLHDGAQQRLLRLSWLARRARQLGTGDEVPALLDELVQEVSLTTGELRELAQGIHPPLVTERGLAVAIEEYALRAPLAVRVDLPPNRFIEPVETTAFFIIMEAIVNAAKYAQTDHVDVAGRVEPGRLVLDIRDRGIGGADARRGTGLRNMADRLTALDGTLTVHSPPGQGTHLRVVLPCE
jgi:signal transduction histidine kinase